MNFQCQAEALKNIKLLAEHNQHGVLIVGDSGSGKTSVAREYAKLLNIKDFYIINPVMADLKSMIDLCLSNSNPVVLCIENLDHGVLQASYPLLKIIEDCPSYIYVVVTCNNLFSIPDTIPSRCALVTINPPTKSDIEQYAKFVDEDAFNILRQTHIWTCIKGLGDVETILKFTPEQLKYFNDLANVIQFKDSISNISWKLQHYEDNTETPIVFVIRYLMGLLKTTHGKQACLECLNDLAENRISQNAIISKFVLENKYCE